MRFQDVKAALLPTVSNVDALYATFVAEHKSNDVERFLVHLKDQGLVTDEQIRKILTKDPLAIGTLATQGPAKKGHLAGPTMTTEMMDDEDDEPAARDGSLPTDPAARPGSIPSTPPEVPAHLKSASVSSTPAPAQPRGQAAPKTGTNPGNSAPSFKATGPGNLRGTGPVGRKTNPSMGGPPSGDSAGAATKDSAASGAAAVADPPSARTPSFPPKAPAAKGDGTPADIPGRGYKFVGKIGEGAMGEVLIAKDLDLHRTVAYKVMSEQIRGQAALAGKFYGEAQITAQLDHPNIVPVYSLDRAPNGGLSYTMKLINGRTMEKLVDETKDQYKSRKIDDGHSLVTRLDQFLKVCDAIHYAHSRGVVHRDLKPENIMIGSYGEVYVMDWGISRLMEVPGAERADLVLVEGYQDDEALKPKGEEDDDDDDADDEDEGGVIIGTPSYMSPEQARGRKTLDGRSDQYALGLILYELVALKQAVTGKSPLKIVMRQRDAEKEPFVHAFGEAIAPEIKAIVDKATKKDPEHRYKDVHAMADDIRRYLRGEAVLARPDTPRQKVMRWVGRHRELTLFMVFVFFTFGAFTVFASVGWQLWSSAQQRAHEQAMTQLLTSTGAQASLIDSYFARYEGQLGIVAASASEMLMRGEVTNDPIFLAGDFDAEGKQPSDFEESKRYGAKISVLHPVFQIPKGSKTTDATMEQFRRLTPLQRYLKRVLLLSHSEQASAYTPKRAERLIRDVGTPLAWATIGLADGGYIGFPGNGGYPENFDARDRPWYKLAKDKREPTWGSPYIDSGGLGLLLPCSMSLFDEEDKFLAVASVQLPFDFIIGELLVTDGLPPGAESFLVNEDGQVVVRSSEKGKTFDTATLRNRGVRMPDFPVTEVVEKIKEKESGRVSVSENGQDDLVLFTRMNSLGWYYVVRGEEDALLAGH